MTSHTNGRRRRARIARTPEQIAAARAEALLWQAILRAEAMAKAFGKPPLRPAREVAETAQRARFAAAIAQAEFGRFYPNA